MGVVHVTEQSSSVVAVIDDGAGQLVIGDPAAIDAVIGEWRGRGELVAAGQVVTGRELARLTQATAAAGVPAARAAQYVRTVRAAGSQTQELRLVTRSVSTGRFVSNVPATAAATAAAAPVALQLAALQVALEAAIAEITASLDRIEDKAAEVLRLASAQRAGHVWGRRRVLERMWDELRSGAPLSDTDWSAVASLGPDLEVGVESLREYLRLLTKDLTTSGSADKRAEALRTTNRTGRLDTTLRLLLGAEQALYLWQLIRIERVQSAEPDHLAATVRSARTALAEHHRLDHEASLDARSALARISVLGLTEVHRKFSAATLRAEVVPLQAQLDEFARQRGLQAEQWSTLTHPGFREALSVAVSDDVIGVGLDAASRVTASVGDTASRVTGSVSRWARRRGSSS